METIIGDCIGTTIGIHAPITYKALDSSAGGSGLIRAHLSVYY